jgi:regulator of protease activity HflC (stomatin/prohibitin superfamily)
VKKEMNITRPRFPGVREVRSDERLVLVRMGRIDQRLRGPGRVFLVPIIDQGVVISLAPQRIHLEDVPARSSEGRGVAVDLEIDYRIVDPVAFVRQHITPPEVGLRIAVRGLLNHLSGARTYGDVLDRAALEAEARPYVIRDLERAGACDVELHVRSVEGREIPDAVEDARLIQLGATWLKRMRAEERRQQR